MALSRWARTLVSAGVFMVVAAPSAASAQMNVDSLRQQYLMRLPPTIPALATVSRASPGSSAGSPTAFGASFGDAFLGAGYQLNTRARIDRTQPQRLGGDDGSIVAGFGLGNARDLVGVEVALTSFSTFRSGFGDRTGVSFKVHRVLPGNWGVGVGWENAHVFGAETDGGSSVYGAVSRVWSQSERSPFLSITTSAGIGNGRFRSLGDVESGHETVNVFGSIGLQVAEPASVIADWTGQDLTLGLSIVPLARLPLIITPAFADVTGQHGNKPRFTLGVGMGLNIRSLVGTH